MTDLIEWPTVAFLHIKKHSSELAWAIRNLKGSPLGRSKEELTRDDSDVNYRKTLEHAGHFEVIFHHWIPEIANKPLTYYVTYQPFSHQYDVHEDEEGNRQELRLDTKILTDSNATILAPYFEVEPWHVPTNRDMAETARRLGTLLDARFAFGDSRIHFTDPSLFDPRSRAWALTYYGPDLVARLGRDRVASAPAWKVEFDERGGAWLWLAEVPFMASAEKEKRRKAVEKHLRLSEVFPNEPQE